MIPPVKSGSNSSLGRATRPSRRRYRQVDVESDDEGSDHDRSGGDGDDDIERQNVPPVPPRSSSAQPVEHNPASTSARGQLTGASAATAHDDGGNDLPLAQEVGHLSTDEASKVVMAHILSGSAAATQPSRDNLPTAYSTPLPPATPERFVNVKTLDDRTVRVVLPPEPFTLRDFRREVEIATGVPVAQQRLIMNGRLLCMEDAPLHLEHGSYLHLAPLAEGARRQRNGSDDTGSSVDDEELEYLPENIIHRQLGQLHALAWVVIVVFTLYSWRLFMNLVFDDDPEHNPVSINVAKFLMSVFGMYVGYYGVNLVSTSRSMTSQAGGSTTMRNVSETKTKVKRYILLLSLLALMYLMSMLQGVQLDKNTFLGVLIIQSTFWYCILQAQVTHRALRESERSPTTTTTTTAAAAAVASTVSPGASETPTVVIAVPAVTATEFVQPRGTDIGREGTEMTVFSSSTASPSTPTAHGGSQTSSRVVTLV